jgi:hypothetical protein
MKDETGAVTKKLLYSEQGRTREAELEDELHARVGYIPSSHRPLDGQGCGRSM